MQITIRSANQQDAAKIRSLVYRAQINPFGLKWQRFYVAESENGDFMGCIQLKPHRDGSFELASLAVEERFRGRGIARVLIERLLENSTRPIYLMCRADLGSFYEKFGFHTAEIDELPAHFRRLRRLFDAAAFLMGRQSGLIMQIDF